jgi:hypothetical protein
MRPAALTGCCHPHPPPAEIRVKARYSMLPEAAGDPEPTLARIGSSRSWCGLKEENIELGALPQPRSRTRMPELNGMWRARLSAWKITFSPRAFSRIQCSPYFAVRGKASSSIDEFTRGCAGLRSNFWDLGWDITCVLPLIRCQNHRPLRINLTARGVLR